MPIHAMQPSSQQSAASQNAGPYHLFLSSVIPSGPPRPCALALAISQDALLTSGLTHKVPKVVITVLDVLIQIFS